MIEKNPRFPGYDVLDKRDTPSWDQITRDVVDARLATPHQPRFLDEHKFAIAQALCRRILPQPTYRPEIPLGPMLDAKLFEDQDEGFREADMPHLREAWRKGLAALDAEAHARFGPRRGFVDLTESEQDALLHDIQDGKLQAREWDEVGGKEFFSKRILVDIPGLYYAHPTAWSELGFGGPASPRGYVRLEGERHDPWEAAEAKPGQEAQARRENTRAI